MQAARQGLQPLGVLWQVCAAPFFPHRYPTRGHFPITRFAPPSCPCVSFTGRGRCGQRHLLL
jgi:hypothetical protein